MITKQCQFSGRDDHGEYIHLLRAGYDNDHLVKVASASPPQLRHVQQIMKGMPKQNGSLYTLVSALGAGEYWGSNSNGDHFGINPLLHVPPGWDSLPYDQQRAVGKNWEWGYPTFYNAHAFSHHQNKDPNRAFGSIEYVTWDPQMKRVLLIVGFDRERAARFGSSSVLDRVENGEFPSVSMGARVPYDLCSIDADWSRITLNPRVDLAEHRRKPIRGLSATEVEYCTHLKSELNKIYPDGRKVMMLNMHPRFFDLSVVFIGADKTSYILAKLANTCPIRPGHKACTKGCYDCAIPSSHVHEVWNRTGVEKIAQSTGRGAWDGYVEDPTAQGPDVDWDDQRKEEKKVGTILKRDRRKLSRVIKTGAIPKDAEILKRVQSNFRQHLPAVEKDEPDLPVDDLDDHDLPDILGSTGAMGVVVKPQEFQRMFLRRLDRPELADDLDRKGLVFRTGGPPDDTSLGSILPEVIKKVLPVIRGRSAMTPSLGKRVVVTAGGTPECDFFSLKAEKGVPDRDMIKAFMRYLDRRDQMEARCEKHSVEPHPHLLKQPIDHPLMDKISSAYSGYRRDLVYKAAGLIKQAAYTHPQIAFALFADDSDPRGLVKEGGDVMKSMIGMLSTMYLNEAYVNEPVSGFVAEHCDLAGLQRAGDLAALGGVA
jgi:hypothetical protein